MDHQTTTDLIKYLSRLGFEGDQLQQALRQQISLQLPSFVLSHQKDYGAERMSYRLFFIKDHQFDAYRLEKYKATHRAEIEIIHDTIFGIDTSALEARMAATDWHTFFAASHQLTVDQKKAIDETMHMLNTIIQQQHFDGIKIQELLMYKYWPTEYYEHPSTQDMIAYYENSHEFNVTKAGLCPADLAYHFVSGRLDDLFQMVSASKAEQLFEKDLYVILSERLSINPESFSLDLQRFNPREYWGFSMPITTISGWYAVDSYQLSIVQFPAIEDKVYKGIPVKQLEAAMAAIDWNDKQALFTSTTSEEPVWNGAVKKVHKQLATMGLDGNGAEVAALLTLKYWGHSSFFHEAISTKAWEIFGQLPKLELSFGAETPADVALHLLQGRPVAERELYPMKKDADNWIQLVFSAEQSHVLDIVADFSPERLQQQVSMLPLISPSVAGVVRELMRGEETAADLPNNIRVWLAVDLQQKTLVIYNSDHKPIAANLFFDAAWQPDALSGHKEKQTKNVHGSHTVKHQQGKDKRGRKP